MLTDTWQGLLGELTVGITKRSGNLPLKIGIVGGLVRQTEIHGRIRHPRVLRAAESVLVVLIGRTQATLKHLACVAIGGTNAASRPSVLITGIDALRLVGVDRGGI